LRSIFEELKRPPEKNKEADIKEKQRIADEKERQRLAKIEADKNRKRTSNTTS